MDNTTEASRPGGMTRRVFTATSVGGIAGLVTGAPAVHARRADYDLVVRNGLVYYVSPTTLWIVDAGTGAGPGSLGNLLAPEGAAFEPDGNLVYLSEIPFVADTLRRRNMSTSSDTIFWSPGGSAETPRSHR